MADGFRIDFAGEDAERLRAAAEARGISVEDFVRMVLQIATDLELNIFDTDDLAEDVAAFEDYERTGMGIPHEEVAAWLRSLTTDKPLPRPPARKLK